MSLDVSPDGRTVVFDLLGDLYTMPATGGAASRIVGGLSFESQPVFSPDGKTIAFLSDRTGVENLWLANADGTNPRAVSKDEKTNDRPQIMASPAWTPDGEFIVVSKARAPDPGTFWLFMYHRDGGSGVRVGAPPPPQPSPDAAPGPPPAAGPEPHGRRRLSRRPLHLLRAAHGQLHVQRALPVVADPSPRPRDRRHGAGDQCPGERDASRALARRHAPRLCHALQDGDGPAHPQPADRRRALARASGHARRSGVARLSRHDAALRVHAGRQVAARADRRQALAHRRRDRRAHARALHRTGAGRDRPARLHAGARGGRRDRPGAADPLALALTRRPPAGLQRPQPPLRDGHAVRRAAPRHARARRHCARRRVHARLVA